MKITKEIKIGLAGVIALGLLIVGINFFKGINLFHSTASYYIAFEDIKGLVKSSPIYADGFKVGIVGDIEYDYAKAGHVTAVSMWILPYVSPKAAQPNCRPTCWEP